MAQKLAAEADVVSRSAGCSAYGAAVKLRSDVIAAIRRIPGRYQEQVMSAANELVARLLVCVAPNHGHGRHEKRKERHKHDQGD
ncbi:MAG: hypothetical protein WBB76_10995 [Gaiellaceae bacterium]